MKAIVVAICSGLFVQSANAQCIIMPLQHHLSDEHVAVVFSVTVRQAQSVPAGQVVTVDVLRLWKGQVAGRTVLYNFQRRDIEEGLVELNVGETYLVIAHIQGTAERAAFGLPGTDEDTLGMSNCMAYPFNSFYTRSTLGDAPGYTPR